MNNNYIILHNCYIKSFKFKLLNIKNSYYISNKEDTSNKNKTSISKIGKEIINLKFNANIISENTYIRDIGILNIIKKDIGNIAIQDITFNELQTFLNKYKT